MTSPMHNPEFIYKIASPEIVSAAQGSGFFTGMPIDLRDGYIHFSTAAQLAETLALHFRGAPALVLLAVRCGDIAVALRWEPSRGGALFPHLYGPLPLTAVAASADIAVAEDGRCVLPEWVR